MLSPQAGLTSETVRATLSSSSSSSSSLSESPAVEKISAAALNKEVNDNDNDVQEQQEEQPPSATFRYTTYSNRLAQLKELEERQLRLQEMCEAALQENELTNNNNNNNNNANSVVKTDTKLTAPTMVNEESPQPYESPSSFFTSLANATKQTNVFNKPFTTTIPAPGKDETALHEDLLTGEVQSFRDAASYTRLSSINSNNSEYNEDGVMNNNKHESLPSLSLSELPSPSYGQQGNELFTTLQAKYNPKSNYLNTNSDINKNYTTTDCNGNKRRIIPAPAPELSRTNPILSKPYHYSTKQAPPPPPPPPPSSVETEQYLAKTWNRNSHNTPSVLENKFSTLRSNWRKKARPSTRHTRQVQHPLHFATHMNKALVSPRSEATSANTTLQKDNYYSVNETNNSNTAHDSTIEDTINKWVTPLHAARVANSRSASPFNKFESSSGIVYTPFPAPAGDENYAGIGDGGDNNKVELKHEDELEKHGSTTHYRVAPLSPASVELDKHITSRNYFGSQYSEINKSNDDNKGDSDGKYQTSVKTSISSFWPLPTQRRSSLLPPPLPESMSLESSISSLLGKTHKRLSLPNRSSLREKYMPHKQSRRNSMHERKARHILVSPSTSDAARVHVTHITSPPMDVVSPFRPRVRSVPVAHRESEKVFEKLLPSSQSRQNAKFVSPPIESEDENLEMYRSFINKRNISRINSHTSSDNKDKSSAIDAVRKLRNQLNRSVLRARYSDHLHKDETMPAAPKSNVESVPKSSKQHKSLPHEQGRNRQSRKTSRLSDVWATDEPSNRHRAASIINNDEEEEEETSSLSTPEYNLEYRQRNNSVTRSKKKNNEGKHKNNEEHSKYDRQRGENKAKNKENRKKERERQSKRTGNTRKAATHDWNRKNGSHPYNNIDDFINDSSHTSEMTTTSSHVSSSSHERTNSIATTSSSISSFSSSESSLSESTYSEERNKNKLRNYNKSHTHHRNKDKSRKENDRAYRKAHSESKTGNENKNKMENRKTRKSRRLSSDHNPEANSRSNNSDINYNNSNAFNKSRHFEDTETAKAKAKAEALARHLAKSITEKKKLNDNVHDLQQDLDDCNDEIARLHRIIERHSAKMESRSALLKELEAKEEEVQLYELKMKRLQRMLAESEQHPWEKEEEESESECLEEQEEEIQSKKQMQKMSSEPKHYSDNKNSNTKVNNRSKWKNVNSTPTKAKALSTENKGKKFIPHSDITTTTTTNNAEDRRKMEEEKCQLAEELTMAMEQIRVLDGKLTEMERNAAASRLREVQSQYKYNKNNHKQANQHREEKITKAKEKEMGRRPMSINMEDKLEEEKGHTSADRKPLTLTTSLSSSSSLAPSTTHSLPPAPSEEIMLQSLPEQGDKLIESLIESNEQAIHQSVVQETEFKDQLRRYELIVNALHHSLRDCLNSLEAQDDEVNELEEVNTHLRSKSREQVEQLDNIKAQATNVSKSITTSRSEAEKVLSLANDVQDVNSTYNKISNNASYNTQNKKEYNGATQNLAPLTVQFVQKAMHDFTLLAKFLRDLREMSVDDEKDNEKDDDEGSKAKIDKDKGKINRDERNKLRAELFKEVDQCVEESEYALQELQKVKENKINNNNKKCNKSIVDGGNYSSCNSGTIVENNDGNKNYNVHRALFHDDDNNNNNNDNNDYVNGGIKRHEKIAKPEEQSLFTEQLSVPDHFDADVDEPLRVDSTMQHNNRNNKLPSTHKKGEVGQVSTKEFLSEEEELIDSTIPSPLPPPPPLPQKLNLSRQHFPLHTKEKREIDNISKNGVGILNSQHDDDDNNAGACNDDRESEWQRHSSSCKKEEEKMPEISSKHDQEKEVQKIQEEPITHSLREEEEEKLNHEEKEEPLPYKPHKESTWKDEYHDVHRHNHLHLLSPASQTGNTIMLQETRDVDHKEEGVTNHESSISPSPVRPEMCDHHLPSQQIMHYYPPQHNSFATALPINRPCESLMREDISSDVSKENDQHDLWSHEEQKKQSNALHDKINTIPLSPILSPPPPLSPLESDEEEVKDQLFAHDEANHFRDKRSTEMLQQYNKEEKEKEKKEQQQEEGKVVHVNELLEEEGLHRLPENVNTSLTKVNEGNEKWENIKNEIDNNVNDRDKNDVTIPFIDALHELTISKGSSNSERHDKLDHVRDVSGISHNSDNNNVDVDVDDDDDDDNNNHNNYCISGPETNNNIAVDNVSVSSPTITENNSYSSSSGKNHYNNFRPYHQEHKEHHNDATMTTNNVHTSNKENETFVKVESAEPKLKYEEKESENRNLHHVLHKKLNTDKASDKNHTEEIKETNRFALERVSSEAREEQEQEQEEELMEKAQEHPRTAAAASDDNGDDDKKEKHHVIDNAESLSSSSLASSSFVSMTAEQEKELEECKQEQLLPEQNKKEDDTKCGVDIHDNLMEEDFDDYNDNGDKENEDKCPSNSDSSSFTWRTTTNTAATTSHPDSEPSASVAHSTFTPSHTFLHTPTVNSIDDGHNVNKLMNDVDIISHASHKDKQAHSVKVGKESDTIENEWEEEKKKKMENSIIGDSVSDGKDVNLTTLQIPSQLVSVAECVESTPSDPVSITVSRTTPNITVAPSTLPTESAHSTLPSELSLPAHKHCNSLTTQEHVNKQLDNKENKEHIGKLKNANVEQVHRNHSTPREVAIEELTQDKIDNYTKNNNITTDVKANIKCSNEDEDKDNKYKIHNVQHNNSKDKLTLTSAHDSKDSVESSARTHVSLPLPHSAERCESIPMPSSIAPQPEPPISPLSSSYSTSRPREQYIISREHSPEIREQQTKMPEKQQQEEELLESEHKDKNHNIKQKHESISSKGKIHTEHVDHDETSANKKPDNTTAVETITPVNSTSNTFVNTPHNIRETFELGKATSERASARQKSPSTRAQSFTRTNSSTSLSSNQVTYRENKAAMMRRELNEPKHKTGVPRINAGIHKARSLLTHSTTTPTSQLIRSTSSSSPVINMENAQDTQQKQSDNTDKNTKAKLMKQHEGLQENNITTAAAASSTAKALLNSESLQQEKLSELSPSANLNTDEHGTNVDKIKENASLSNSPQITPIKQVNAKPSDLPISLKKEQQMLMEEEEKLECTNESYDFSPEPRVMSVEMHTPRLHSTSSRHNYTELPLMKVKVSPVSATTKSLMHPYTIVSTSPDHTDESNNNWNNYKYKWSKAGSVPSSQFSRKSSLRSSEIPEYVYARMPANRLARSTTRSHSSYSQEQVTEQSPDALHRVKEQKPTSVGKKFNNDNDNIGDGNVNRAKYEIVDNEVEPQECHTHGPLAKNEKIMKGEHEKLQREQEVTTSHTDSSKRLNLAMKTSARFATSLSSTSLSSSSLTSLHKKSHSPRRPVMQKPSTLHNKASLHQPLTHTQKEEEWELEEKKPTHQSKEDCTAASSRSYAKSTSLSAREPPSPKRSTAEFTGFVHDEVVGVGHDERESTTPPAQHIHMNSTKRQSISTSGSESSHQASMPMERISLRSTENSPLNTYNTITISPLTTSPSISPMRRSVSMQRSPTQLKTAPIPTIKKTSCNTESEDKNLSGNIRGNDNSNTGIKEEVERARHASPSPRSIKEETLTSKQTPSRKSLSNHNTNTEIASSPSSIERKPIYTVHSTPIGSNAPAHKSNNVIDVPESTLTSLRQPLSPQSPATSARKAEVEKILQRLRAKRVDSARRRQQYEKK